VKWKSFVVAIDEEEHKDEAAALPVGCTILPLHPEGFVLIVQRFDSWLNGAP
jgi:hypothetical protein